MRRAAALLAFVCMVALVVAAGAGAKTTPNNSCDTGTKIDPVLSGTYALASGSVTVTVRSTDQGQVFDFDTGPFGSGIATVTVKGGTGSAVYTEFVQSDTGLHAPLNPNSGQWYDLSYVCFVQSGGGIG
jgi:hypothetical protein